MRNPPPPLGLSVAVALLVGVSAVQLAPALPALWISAGMLVPAAWLYSRQGLLRILGSVLLGVFWACLVGQWVMQHRLPPGLSGQDFVVEGRVVGLPQREDESLRFDFQIDSSHPEAPIGNRVRLGWYGRAAPESWSSGRA